MPFASELVPAPESGFLVQTICSAPDSLQSLPEHPGTERRSGMLPASISVSVVIPTFNEAANISELVRRVGEALAGIDWELIFVDDDSPDGTAEAVRTIARTDHRIRCLQRIGRRGLSSACVEGMLAAAAPAIAVMDGDLQHDELLLPSMLALIQAGSADVVIGSRYTAGGSTGTWSEERARMSRLATSASRLVLKQPVSDPMSGFFMLDRSVLEQTVRRLSSIGFKILLDILATSTRPLRIAELPYTFRERSAGESKLDHTVVWEYAMLLLDKSIGRYLPVRFLSFALIGGAGVLVHMGILATLFKAMGLSFALSQTVATFVAMTFNFALNNELTYRDRRLRGWGWWRGLGSFVAACSVGAAANVGIANYLYQAETRWFLAAISGVVIGAVWNYAVTSLYTWRNKSA